MERNIRPLNKKQIRSQATLETLRTVVDKLVEELGFEKMHIRDICREAGITPGTFYHYFPSKDDILFDRYLRVNIFLNKLYDEKLKKMHAIDALKLFFKEFIKWEKKRVIGVLISFQRARILHYSEWAEKEKPATNEIITALFTAGLEKGTIKPGLSPRQLSGFFVCLFEGMIINQCYSRGQSLKHPDFLEPANQWLESLRVRKTTTLRTPRTGVQ
ncbi:MAG: TetR/AcrR family transcriptional regulator [Spirochaetaceae bacterium]|nr:TetR/AcrR family transcriptional regulator [Spirochaetaceae bacterium]